MGLWSKGGRGSEGAGKCKMLRVSICSGAMTSGLSVVVLLKWGNICCWAGLGMRILGRQGTERNGTERRGFARDDDTLG